jgi:uncharacterized protein involved in type VI secretion and phage assembly
MMQRMMNAMRGEGQRAAGTKSLPRRGTVSAYDPDNYAIQPEGFESGFLPIASSWVGNLWGMFCPPTQGDEVDVHFQEGGKNAAYISLRFFGGKARPLSVPSGEFWVVHKSGSFIKFTNDGKVQITDATGGAVMTLNNNGTMTLFSNVIVFGSITATQDIMDHSASGGSTMADFRAVYDEHTHPTPSGTSGPPDQEI